MAALDVLLKVAEQHVEQGGQRVERQRKVLENLEDAGRDTTTAEEVLAMFERAQAKFEADHERLVQSKKHLVAQQGPSNSGS